MSLALVLDTQEGGPEAMPTAVFIEVPNAKINLPNVTESPEIQLTEVVGVNLLHLQLGTVSLRHLRII